MSIMYYLQNIECSKIQLQVEYIRYNLERGEIDKCYFNTFLLLKNHRFIYLWSFKWPWSVGIKLKVVILPVKPVWYCKHPFLGLSKKYKIVEKIIFCLKQQSFKKIDPPIIRATWNLGDFYFPHSSSRSSRKWERNCRCVWC